MIKRLSIFSLALVFLAPGCSKDDNKNDEPDPQAQTSTFTLTSNDNTFDISGSALLIPSFAGDSLITVSMTGTNDESVVQMNLYNSPDAWNTSTFTLYADSVNSQNFFSITLSIDSLTSGYVAIEGSVDITDKQKGEFIAGDMNLLLINPGAQDSLSASGSFHAIEEF